jgi:hypothetical protein
MRHRKRRRGSKEPKTTHIPAVQLLMGWMRTTRRAQREKGKGGERGQDGTGEVRINGRY